jgi:hypothetical protein
MLSRASDAAWGNTRGPARPNVDVGCPDPDLNVGGRDSWTMPCVTRVFRMRLAT